MGSAAVFRIPTLAFGFLAASWGATTFPYFWRDHSVEQVAQRIILGESFPLESLVGLIPILDAIEMDPFCRPAVRHSDAIIRLNIAEITLGAADVTHLDERLARSREAIVRSLTCSPSDPFLWLGLYRVNSVMNGFNADDLKFLRMSYELGPNEGWVIVKRNGAALAVFPELPADLADMALIEFTKLLEPGLVPFAVDIFIGPGWPIRDTLLARIANTPEVQRQAFADLLRSRGYDVAVPGIAHKDRPWL